MRFRDLTRFSCLALITFILTGCATFQQGESIVKWTEGDQLRMAEAPASGTYALYSGTDLRNPQIQYQLQRGDRLGFLERNGSVYAVAGDHEVRVETGTITKSYFWRKVK